jgi:hypothetical protein
MNEADFNRLLEIAMRRPLTADEEARLLDRLAHDPAAKAAWEEEMALNQVLHRLPDAPLATNFTARVLQTVERDRHGRPGRAPGILRRLGLSRPVQRFAAACLTLALIALGYWQYRSLAREKIAVSLAKIANHLEEISAVTELPPAETWGDFDAINRLPQAQPQADEQLLAVLEMTAK